ncbi:hypothetical protein RAS1_22110 [Phycisphaerae bacterium RAS1]|nr:hypothetical protein RAS1_22110 [Phycisphaerae bacterium RAS1]
MFGASLSLLSALFVAASPKPTASDAEAARSPITGGAGELCTLAVPINCGDTVVVDLRTFDQAGDPPHPCRNGGAGGANSAWYSFVPPAGSTTVRIQTCDSTGTPADTVMTLWSGACGGLTLVACSDDACGTGNGYLSDICADGLTPGATHYLEVGAWQASDAGLYTIKVECPCPVFEPAACCSVDGADCQDGVIGAACAASGGLFHPDTTCGAIACVALCQPGDQDEGESFCNDPDDFNNGCNNPSPVFPPPYVCGDTICGEYWAEGGRRDTDWYAFDLSVESQVTWRVTGSASTRVFIFAPGPDPLNPCTGLSEIADAIAPAFQPAVGSACLPPGRYYLWAGHDTFSGVPCVGRYHAEIACQPCPSGACCLAPTCQDGLDAAGCVAAGGIYQGDGTLCANVDCLGACCLADESCSNLTEPACTAANGVFNGQGTRCGDAFIFCNGACCACPAACTVTSQQNCQAAGGFFQGGGSTCADVNNCAASIEGETVCTPGTDHFNGGCNSTPNVFSMIACGQTVCGRSANPSGFGPRDSDWYRFELTQPTRVRWEVVGNTRMQANLLQLTAGNCPATNVTSVITDRPFEPAVVEVVLAPGAYVAYAAVPLSVPPGVPCGANAYRATLTCRTACADSVCGDSNCDGVVNVLDINFFVAAVLGEAQWNALHSGSPTCSYCCSNDVNGNGVVNILDINAFVAAVLDGSCANSPNCPP